MITPLGLWGEFTQPWNPNFAEPYTDTNFQIFSSPVRRIRLSPGGLRLLLDFHEDEAPGVPPVMI